MIDCANAIKEYISFSIISNYFLIKSVLHGKLGLLLYEKHFSTIEIVKNGMIEYFTRKIISIFQYYRSF